MIRLFCLAAGLAMAAGARAAPDDPPKSPAEELKQLRKEASDAQSRVNELRLKIQKSKDDDEKKELNEDLRKASQDSAKVMRENTAKAIAIAKADPRSATGLDAAAFGWSSLRTKPAELLELVGAVVENHAANRKMAGMIQPLTVLAATTPRPGASDEDVAKAKERSAKAVTLLELIGAKSPEKPIQASAWFAIADFYKNKSEPRGKAPPPDADELARKAEGLFERIEKDYSDLTQFRDRTYGAAAKAALFELRNLRVGKIAPDIEGEDVDGARFKLSDYRGKVVMLDFWGHW